MIDVDKSRKECEEFISAESSRHAFSQSANDVHRVEEMNTRKERVRVVCL